MLYFLCSFCFLILRCVLLLRSCVDRSIKLLAFYRLSKCTIPSGYGLARFLCAYLVEQIHALQAQFALRKPTILASEVSGLPESKHFDGTNYSDLCYSPRRSTCSGTFPESVLPTLIFDKYGWRIVDIAFKVLRQHILSTATQYNGLYQLNRRDHWAMAVQDVPDLWHRRLRHLKHLINEALARWASNWHSI
ncbi:hypothetical protein T4C_7976 [Trichinella pseudospiralis]|uniref:Uncharacterized protein n=1 Tax=Trichinella pseudospiralis TaxID=6337 RepID=A0A0V1JLF8_TRIPS|nr:hypothetical protein T4C_7976 [Trichinella pseudospiralis]